MTNPHVRTTHLKDTIDVYNDIQNGSLPSVSFVKPSGFVDRHPASSKLDLFEGFVKKIITLVQANPKLWPDIAIFITFDEESGYWDSGYVQALDHFGDGTVFRCLWCRPTPPEGRPRFVSQVCREELATQPTHTAWPRQPAQPSRGTG
jgi:hypothetical protein